MSARKFKAPDAVPLPTLEDHWFRDRWNEIKALGHALREKRGRISRPRGQRDHCLAAGGVIDRRKKLVGEWRPLPKNFALPDGQQWADLAATPLGIMLARGFITPRQYEAGIWYADRPLMKAAKRLEYRYTLVATSNARNRKLAAGSPINALTDGYVSPAIAKPTRLLAIRPSVCL